MVIVLQYRRSGMMIKKINLSKSFRTVHVIILLGGHKFVIFGARGGCCVNCKPVI